MNEVHSGRTRLSLVSHSLWLFLDQGSYNPSPRWHTARWLSPFTVSSLLKQFPLTLKCPGHISFTWRSGYPIGTPRGSQCITISDTLVTLSNQRLIPATSGLTLTGRVTMIATKTVPSSLADLREMPLTEMVALSAGTVEEALRRILPDVPVAPEPKFNSTI